MKKRKTRILFAAIVMLLTVIGVRWIYGHIVVRSLATKIPQIEQIDACEIRKSSSLPLQEHIELTLAGEELKAFLDYLDTVQVTAPLRSHGYEVKGQYYIGFYRQGEQIAEMLASYTGELGILYNGQFRYYQVQMGNQKEFAIPSEN